MKYIDFDTIRSINVTPSQCVEWAKQALLHKYTSILPPKISIKFNDVCFFNTMPSLLPEINRFGVKVVSRFPQTASTIHGEVLPSLSADIMLYDSTTGELLSIMDGTWITAMRTGAVAAISIDLLKKKSTNSYSFIGLGNTARATLLCLNEVLDNKNIDVKVLSYKDQHTSFIERFSMFKNITFKVYDSVTDLIKSSDVIISCVTTIKGNFSDDSDFSEGILVVPVHTLGFQNCDLFFDKVFCDDIGHVETFKYFKEFKHCDEVSNILLGKSIGRESEMERILAYNIGISIHDVYFASNIYDELCKQGIVLTQSKLTRFWV
jgi:ornithine cyclodeaminase/alanine dehydrogenase-like protein (mu-crystallin family)